MASSGVNLGNVVINSTSADQVVLIARTDMSIVKASCLAPLVMIVVGIAAYFLPLPVDRDVQSVLSVFIVGIGFVGILGLLAAYEVLSRAVYTLTAEYVEEGYGIINKRLRRIPLSYIRDVTQTQNPLQAVFGISSVTVSPTNGDTIVLSNIKNGDEACEIIWKSVLSRTLH